MERIYFDAYLSMALSGDGLHILGGDHGVDQCDPIRLTDDQRECIAGVLNGMARYHHDVQIAMHRAQNRLDNLTADLEAALKRSTADILKEAQWFG